MLPKTAPVRSGSALRPVKKIGIAVERSRARRVIREAFRTMCEEVKPGYDIVFVARSLTCKVKMQEVATAMRSHLKKARLLP
jgi:ribonuclease P protein component